MSQLSFFFRNLICKKLTDDRLTNIHPKVLFCDVHLDVFFFCKLCIKIEFVNKVHAHYIVQK